MQEHRGIGDNIGRDKIINLFPNVNLPRLLYFLVLVLMMFLSYNWFNTKSSTKIFPNDGFNVLIVPFVSTCKKDGDFSIATELKIRLERYTKEENSLVNVELLDTEIKEGFDKNDAYDLMDKYQSDQVIYGFFCQNGEDDISISYNWVLKDDWNLNGAVNSGTDNNFKEISIADIRSGYLQLETSDPPIDFLLGLYNLESNQFKKAKEKFGNLLKIASENNRFKFLLSVSEIRLGNLIEAKKILRSIISDDVRHFDAYRELGALKLMEGDLDSAKYYTEKSLEIDTANLASMYNLGMIEDVLGEPAIAKNYFSKAFILSSNTFIDALYMEGLMNEVQGNTDASLQIYYRCININEYYAPAYYAIGHVYSTLGFPLKAIQY